MAILTITPSAITTPNVGTAYSATLSVSGGTAPYTWEHADPPMGGERVAGESSALPLGLSVSSGGVISGTPTVAGAFVFYVRVWDSAGSSASIRYSGSVTQVTSFTATAAVTAKKATASSTAAQGISGTVAYAAKKPLVASSGTEQYIAAGTPASKKPSTTVAVVERFTAVADTIGKKPTVSAGSSLGGAISGTVVLAGKKPIVVSSTSEAFLATASLASGKKPVTTSAAFTASGAIASVVVAGRKPAVSGTSVNTSTSAGQVAAASKKPRVSVSAHMPTNFPALAPNAPRFVPLARAGVIRQ